jgi:CBS domain-containing protein
MEHTGAHWMLESYNELKKKCTNDEAIASITEGIYQRQKTGTPVHKWKPAVFEEGGSWKSKYWKIGQVMTTDLITVGPDELIDLVRNVMLWSNIRHVPIENENGELIGMVSSDTLLNFYGSENRRRWEEVEASEIMEKDPITVGPETLTMDAIKIMRQNELSCLPVISKGKLVGLFTERDYIKFGQYIFDELDQQINKKKKS